MIIIKTDEQVAGIRKSCHLLANLLDEVENGLLKDGMSTYDIDKYCHDWIVKHNGRPAFLDYGGFPGTACVSVNETIIHGIPSKKRHIHNGDLVSVDLGINLGGYFSDSCRTVIVGGKTKPEWAELNKVTRECLYKGIEAINRPGARIHDIGRAVFEHADSHGYGVVREYCGHGVGLAVHEDPEIPNYVSKFSLNPRLKPGMVIAIEPMINLGSQEIIDDYDDGWTVTTADGLPASHWEHTVLITDSGVEILTQV